MFGFELFWPRTLVTDPGLLAYGMTVLGMTFVIAVPALVGQARQYGKPIPVPIAMLAACVFLAGATGPYLLRQALTIVPFKAGVISTEKREFLITGGGENWRSGETVIRVSPKDYRGRRNIALTVDPKVMATLTESAYAFRRGERSEQDCIVLTTEVGLWGYERVYSGSQFGRPVGELFLSERC